MSGPGTPVPGGGRGRARPRPAGPAALQPFAQDFFGDLMPAVENTFRVSARPEHRAIGGLSAGGAATINTAFSRPELFRYVIIMSAGGGQNLEPLYPKFFGNSAAAAKQMKLIWLAVGDEDFALNGTKAIDELLTKHGVKHTFTITQGQTRVAAVAAAPVRVRAVAVPVARRQPHDSHAMSRSTSAGFSTTAGGAGIRDGSSSSPR